MVGRPRSVFPSGQSRLCLRLCTFTVLVLSLPRHRVCSLSCVSSFLGKYFTRHARPLFFRLSLAQPALADAHSCANFKAIASASLSHPCSVLGSFDFPCTGTEAVRFRTIDMSSQSVSPTVTPLFTATCAVRKRTNPRILRFNLCVSRNPALRHLQQG